MYNLHNPVICFQRNNIGGTLTFDLGSENNNVIQFSDRPFRQTENISITEFVDLFTLSGSNSFEEDPPNMVLVHNEEQRTYEMKLSSKSNNQVVFTLELLPGENHNLTTLTGRMNLFVDNIDTSNTDNTLYITNNNSDSTISFNTRYDKIIINDDVVNVTLENVSTTRLTNNGNNITLSGKIAIRYLDNYGNLTIAGRTIRDIQTLTNNSSLTISSEVRIVICINNRNSTITTTGNNPRSRNVRIVLRLTNRGTVNIYNNSLFINSYSNSGSASINRIN
jgi:hypothetical protein